MRGKEFLISGSGAERAVEKLARGGVPVLSARLGQKNTVRIRVDGKHGKKVFAILQGSCYNIINCRRFGAERLAAGLVRRAGLLAGLLLALVLVLFCEGRVLKVSVRGSGACYEAEVRAALAAAGTRFFSPVPDEAAVASHILALPRVSFCSLSHAGGVLTVRVETEDEALPPVGGDFKAPVSGTLERLVVVQGRACAAAGDEVAAGDVLVDGAGAPVIACAQIAYRVDAVYAGSAEQARAQAYLDHGEIGEMQVQKIGEGWRVTGIARTVAARNLG